MKLTPILYIVVILVMAWLGWELWSQTGLKRSLPAFIGVALFVISDTILALNRFRQKFKPVRALNLATFFMAQVLIATSVGNAVY